ncbi:MAG TPA: hypothetical protein VLE95_02175 [Chlamydiales bacterium]|nr:hypothetical protein [Chlamydiales bacterium]
MSSSRPIHRPKKLLIITSSGGGGLIQAAIAKEQQAKAEDPTIQIIRKDVLKDWMGHVFGKFCAETWNGAQMKGNVATLRFVIWAQYIFDYFSWPYFFFRALSTLFQEDVDQVIDTQPLGTLAILRALRIYNAKKNKQIRLQKILVDLPTKSATHFFRPIKKLSKKNRSLLQLTTIMPLLEEGQSAEDFWQKNCRLSAKDVHYEEFYVRQAFRIYQRQEKKEKDFPLFLRYKNEEELRLIQRTFSRGRCQGVVKRDEIHFSIAAKDRMITILLGSQPAEEATLNYVRKFLEIGQAVDDLKTSYQIFVFCSEHRPLEQTLFRKIADDVHRMQKYPKHITIIPFSFQSDDCIAPLFFRSDLTCTRSGGQTAMELMCVSHGEMWIHSETKKDPQKKEDLSLKHLLSGIPGWEAANALYLQKTYKAKIVTPEIIDPLVHKFFQSNKHIDLSIHAIESMA